MDYTEIGNNIKLCRIRQHMKQAELAELVNVSAQHISHIECGRTKLGLPLLVMIAESLSVDLYTLLGSNVKMKSSEVVGEEMAEVLKTASYEQKVLCLAVCRTIIEHEKNL